MALLDKKPLVFGRPVSTRRDAAGDSPDPTRPQGLSPVDRRGSIRYPLQLPVLIVAADGNLISLPAQTCNISSTGVLLHCSEELTAEQSVEYVINLYPDYNLRLRCKGRVERSARSSTPAAGLDETYTLALTLDTFEFVRQTKSTALR